MKRIWMLLLLLSLGLNIGLGYKVLTRHADPGEFMRGGSGRFGERGHGRRQHTARDSTAWQQMSRQRLARLTVKLELTPEQVEAFTRIQQQTIPQLRQRRMTVGQIRGRLYAACMRNEAGPDSVRQVVTQLNEAHGRLDSLITETLLAELDLLTPHQREQYLNSMPWEIGPGRRGKPGGSPGRFR